MTSIAPIAAGGKGQPGGQPPAAGGKGQAPQGGQQPGMGGMFSPQVQQPYGGFGQQPGMGGEQPQQAVPQDLIRPLPGMGGQQGIMQQTYNDFLRQTGLPANLMQPGMGGQQPQVSLPQGMGGQQPGMGGQQGTPPNIASLLANPQFRALLGGGQQGQQPPQPPQMQQRPNITQQMRAGAANMTPQQMQNITQQMRAGAAGMTPEQKAAITAQMRKGPQPNNPLAQPQQVRPEDARMQAMRGLQLLGDFKRYMG